MLTNKGANGTLGNGLKAINTTLISMILKEKQENT